MGNELQKELEKMNNEIEKHEDYLKSEKTTYGLADLINGKIPSKQLPSEVNLTANTLEEMNALIASGAVNDGQLCYLKEDKKLYVLKDNVWTEVGGGGIPVVEGTASTITTGGAYATYTIPEAQTSCFIFKCDLGTAFISYNDVFGTYNGYLDAEGDVTDGSLKLNDLIVLSGSGTEIDIFFGNIVSSGGTITSPTLDLVEKTSNGVFKPRTSITSNEYENLKNNLYNQVNYTDAIESSEDLPMALPTKIYKIDDNNYYFTQFSADGTGLSSLVLYKLAINNNNITITKTFDFNIGSSNKGSLVLEYGYIETGGFPQDDTTSVSASFRVNIDALEYISMETIIVYANGENNPVMFNVAKDSLGHKYNSVCFNDDNSIYFYYLTEFELTSVSDNKYSVAFKVRRKTIPASTTTITFED